MAKATPPRQPTTKTATPPAATQVAATQIAATQVAGAGTDIVSNPNYKILVIINFAICVISILIMLWASSFVDDVTKDMPKHKEKLFNVFQYTFFATSGVFVGLLGGRAAAPDSKIK